MRKWPRRENGPARGREGGEATVERSVEAFVIGSCGVKNGAVFEGGTDGEDEGANVKRRVCA